MLKISALFNETKNKIHKKHIKRMHRKCNLLDKNIVLPSITYPKINTEEFIEDIEEVKRCYKNPCLNKNFLVTSDMSIEEIYKIFCSENNIDINWEFIAKLLKDVDTIVLNLKYNLDRPRPKYHLKHQSDLYKNIKDSKSPSFPSGHTTMAYFLSEVISEEYKELYDDLRTLADLIGQSRIELGVHFPTDVLYGKLIGELLAKNFVNDKKIKKVKLKKNDYKNFKNYLLDLINKNNYSGNAIEYCKDFGNFLQRTNEIEGIRLSFEECYEAAKSFMEGYPVKYTSKNPHLRSQLRCLTAAYILGDINSFSNMLNIHKQFDPSTLKQCAPGEIRNYNSHSITGLKYAPKEKILDYIGNIHKINNPWIKHVIFEWIHPFNDGNGRMGRILLLKDLDFNFQKIFPLIDYNYIKRIENFLNANDLNKVFL